MKLSIFALIGCVAATKLNGVQNFAEVNGDDYLLLGGGDSRYVLTGGSSQQQFVT